MAASDKPALNGADIRRALEQHAEKEAEKASTAKADAKAASTTTEKKG